jgi:hypothetical protein
MNVSGTVSVHSESITFKMIGGETFTARFIEMVSVDDHLGKLSNRFLVDQSCRTIEKIP